MRSSLLNLITKTVVYKYSLPNPALNLYKSEHSTRDDDCYESLDDKKLSEIIYNLIIEYSFNEFEITKNTYENLFKIALQIKLKYDENYDESQKLKLGFYGEVLLYGILYSKYNSKPLISRGYFYSPSENAETKGYDCYHLVEHDGKVELWFGESKFMESFPKCIDSVFDNIDKALSDEYLCKRNLLSIVGQKDRISIKNSTIEKIISNWEKNPTLESLKEEITKYNLELVYPIFLTSTMLETYEKTISHAIERINTKMVNKNLSIPVTLFFIFLPVKNSSEIKRRVIKWIESTKPLLS